MTGDETPKFWWTKAKRQEWQRARDAKQERERRHTELRLARDEEQRRSAQRRADDDFMHPLNPMSPVWVGRSTAASASFANDDTPTKAVQETTYSAPSYESPSPSPSDSPRSSGTD